MKTAHPIWQSICAAAAVTVVLCLLPACKPSVAPAAAVKPVVAARTNTSAQIAKPLTNEFASVFEEMMPPNGKDPFYPNSHRRDPVPVVVLAATEKPAPASELYLKGVLGPQTHRVAVVNNISLEVGEAGTARVPGGHVRVKCMEIGEDFAVLQVEGEIQTKRLQLKKKGF